MAVTAYRTNHVAGALRGRPISTLRTAVEDAAFAETILCNAVKDALADEASKVGLRAVPGVAGQAIIETAREVRAHLIVLAGRAGISVPSAGISLYMPRNARCPVMVVPDGRGAG